MKVKENTVKKPADIKKDSAIDKLDSGTIGAHKRDVLKKHKASILAAVAKHRD